MKNRVDKKIKDITTEIGVVNAGEIKHTKLALDAYRSVKSTLRRQRVKLTQLADKTVRVTDDLLLYLEAWGPDYSGEEKKSYLKIQMNLPESRFFQEWTLHKFLKAWILIKLLIILITMLVLQGIQATLQ